MGWKDVESNRPQKLHPSSERYCNRCKRITIWIYHPERHHSRCAICGNGWAGKSGLGHDRVPHSKRL